MAAGTLGAAAGFVVGAMVVKVGVGMKALAASETEASSAGVVDAAGSDSRLAAVEVSGGRIATIFVSDRNGDGCGTGIGGSDAGSGLLGKVFASLLSLDSLELSC